MPSYDFSCQSCGREFERQCPIAARNEQSCDCGSTQLERLYLPHGVVGDDIPGGVLIEHGICHPDGTPKRYDTRSSIQRALDKAHLVDAREVQGVRWRAKRSVFPDVSETVRREVAIAEAHGISDKTPPAEFKAYLEQRRRR